jgi:dynein heavy chain
MFGIAPAKMADPAGGSKKVDDYWTPGKLLLGSSSLIKDLKGYDKDNIDPARIAKLRKEFIPLENFKPDIVKG